MMFIKLWYIIIIIINNDIMENYWKFSIKLSMEIFLNFRENYEIFREIFPPHITMLQ